MFSIAIDVCLIKDLENKVYITSQIFYFIF